MAKSSYILYNVALFRVVLTLRLNNSDILFHEKKIVNKKYCGYWGFIMNNIKLTDFIDLEWVMRKVDACKFSSLTFLTLKHELTCLNKQSFND